MDNKASTSGVPKAQQDQQDKDININIDISDCIDDIIQIIDRTMTLVEKIIVDLPAYLAAFESHFDSTLNMDKTALIKEGFNLNRIRLVVKCDRTTLQKSYNETNLLKVLSEIQKFKDAAAKFVSRAARTTHKNSIIVMHKVKDPHGDEYGLPHSPISEYGDDESPQQTPITMIVNEGYEEEDKEKGNDEQEKDDDDDGDSLP